MQTLKADAARKCNMQRQHANATGKRNVQNAKAKGNFANTKRNLQGANASCKRNMGYNVQTVGVVGGSKIEGSRREILTSKFY